VPTLRFSIFGVNAQYIKESGSIILCYHFFMTIEYLLFTRTFSAPACYPAKPERQTGRRLPYDNKRFTLVAPAHALPATVPVSPAEEQAAVELPTAGHGSKMRHVFSCPDLFMQLAMSIAFTCLHKEDYPLIASLLLVCRSFSAMRRFAYHAIRQTLSSLLRLDDPIVRQTVDNMGDKDWIRLFETYRYVRRRGYNPVLGSFLTHTPLIARERFIPLGFEKSLLIGDGKANVRESRAHALKQMINFCLMGRVAHLNNLIIYGIFSDPDNRADALAFLTYQEEVSRHTGVRYDSFRCSTLTYLLRDSYYIDDVSDVIATRNSVLQDIPRTYGLQLTFNPADLKRCNDVLQNKCSQLTVFKE
jgi:hypothetical protein